MSQEYVVVFVDKNGLTLAHKIEGLDFDKVEEFVEEGIYDLYPEAGFVYLHVGEDINLALSDFNDSRKFYNKELIA